MAKITGKTPAKKSAIKRAAADTTKRTTTSRRNVTASGDQAPETKSTTKAQQAAAEKLFQGADGAMRTEEQHKNHVRRAALGY